MDSLRVRWRSARAQVGILLMAMVGLGLVALPPAHASCAGPQLALEQGGAPVTARRVGEGETEKILHDIARDQTLRVKGSNLTFDCQDTYPTNRRGCGPPVPESIQPIVPLHNAELVLTQRDRSWTLGNVGTINPDLTAEVDLTLPRGLQPGPATLSLLDRQEGSGPQLQLVVTLT